MILFTTSIIGIIYSYNKRIFDLAKQERDNYKVFKKKFDELFTNLYIVDLLTLGYHGERIKNLDVLLGAYQEDIELNYNYNDVISSKTLIIVGKLSLTTTTLSLDPINRSLNISDKIDRLKGKRSQLADKLKGEEVKNEIIEDIKRLFGENIEITKFNYPNNIDNIINELKTTGSANVEYTLEIGKKITINPPNNKKKEIITKYEITLEYEVSMPGKVITNYQKIFNGDPIYDIYGNITGYSYNISDTATAKAILTSGANLTKFQVKRKK